MTILRVYEVQVKENDQIGSFMVGSDSPANAMEAAKRFGFEPIKASTLKAAKA